MDQGLDIDIALLEEKIRQAVKLCQRLRDENRDLRHQVSGLEGDRRALEERIEAARSRLEHLLERMPE